MPYLNGDQLMYTIHLELEKNFFDLELESYQDFFIELEEDDVPELDFNEE